MCREQTNESKLLELATDKFRSRVRPFSKAEKGLLRAAATGERLEVLSRNDVADEGSWGEEQTIDAQLIEWLCTDTRVIDFVTRLGLTITGAKIQDSRSDRREVGLDLDFANIPFPLRMVGCFFVGNISLQHATIKLLVLSGSRVKSLKADSATIQGNLVLRNCFQASEEVSLIGASVGGNLDCSGSFFDNVTSDNDNDKSISADAISVKHNIYLDNGFKATKTVSLVSAKIGGDLICLGHDPHDTESKTTSECFNLHLERAHIEKTLMMHSGFQIKGDLSLIGATIGTLADDKSCWPSQGHLHVNGFKYDRIEQISPRKAKSRLEWLGLTKAFSPGPYEQLASVFRNMGQDDEVWKIQIAKVNAHQQNRTISGQCRLWSLLSKIFWGGTIGYGYRSRRVLWWIAGFVVLGWILFCFSNSNGLMANTQTASDLPSGQTFNALVYSLDTFVPLVNLHQHEYWLPDATKFWGSWLRAWMWLEIGAGWFLSTIGLAGVTGLIKK